ncbi:MAG: M15 family metallopeptidase [Colwellia sp.]|nr:M15 family metallopeptidase [Colwellia sp.]
MTTRDSITTAQVLGQTEQHLHYISEGVAIHKEMVLAFEAMVCAAKADNIKLKIASGFRSFNRQIFLWNNKFSGKTAIKDSSGATLSAEDLAPLDLMHSILLYSALPGASRHHWGCDIDVYAPNLLEPGYQLQLEPWEYDEEGPLAKLTAWLKQHVHLFGFYFPYSHYQGGVAAEPWHLSYLPLAQLYQHNFDISQLAEALKCSGILGEELIIENLDDIATRYINNLCVAPANVILSNNKHTKKNEETRQ